MENIALSRLGKPRESVESLVVGLAMQEVSERVPTSRLTAADAGRAARVAKLRIALLIEGRPGANDNWPLGHDPNSDQGLACRSWRPYNR